jgi:hypothetical protein
MVRHYYYFFQGIAVTRVRLADGTLHGWDFVSLSMPVYFLAAVEV